MLNRYILKIKNKASFTNQILFVFVLFLILSKLALASHGDNNYPSFDGTNSFSNQICVDDDVKDCETGSEFPNLTNNDSVNYQAYEVNVSGYRTDIPSGGDAATRLDVCISNGPLMWTSDYCWLVFDTLTFSYQTFNQTYSIDSSDKADFNHAVAAVRVDNTTVSLDMRVKGRRVHVDSLNASPNPVIVGQNFNISWSTTNDTQLSKFEYGGSMTCNDGNGSFVPADGSTTCTGTSAGTPQFKITSYGPGHNGPTDVSLTKDIQINPLPVPTADIRCSGSNSCSIAYNTSAALSWTSSNVTSCSVSPGGWTGTSNSNQPTPNLTSTTIYTLSCTGSYGSVQDSVTVTVQPLPEADIKCNGADSCTIASGTSAVLEWCGSGSNNHVCANATSCTVGSWSGTRGTQSTGALTSSTTYTLNCIGPGGSRSDDVVVTVTVAGSPTVTGSLTANPSSGNAPLNPSLTAAVTGGSATGNITYQFDCTSDGSFENTVGPTSNTSATYNGCTYNSSGTAKVRITRQGVITEPVASVTVTVAGQPPPTCSTSFTPSSVTVGQSTTHSWSSSGDADNNIPYSCSGNLGSGILGANGSRVVTPSTSQSCTLTVANTSGTNTCPASVAISVITGDIDCGNPRSDGPCTINYGQDILISWNATNANSCNIIPLEGLPGWGQVNPNSSNTDTPSQTRTYQLECWNGTEINSNLDTVTVNVNAAPPPPPPGNVTLYGYVYEDNNRNGTYNFLLGDRPYNGGVVSLTNDDGSLFYDQYTT